MSLFFLNDFCIVTHDSSDPAPFFSGPFGPTAVASGCRLLFNYWPSSSMRSFLFSLFCGLGRLPFCGLVCLAFLGQELPVIRSPSLFPVERPPNFNQMSAPSFLLLSFFVDVPAPYDDGFGSFRAASFLCSYCTTDQPPPLLFVLSPHPKQCPLDLISDSFFSPFFISSPPLVFFLFRTGSPPSLGFNGFAQNTWETNLPLSSDPQYGTSHNHFPYLRVSRHDLVPLYLLMIPCFLSCTVISLPL